jgi:protein-disulfide isomerase
MNQGAKSIMIGLVSLLVGAGGAVLAIGATPTATEKVSASDRAAIEKIVREYILAHPEILPEAMQNLEKREAAKRLNEQGSAMTKPFASAWEGSSEPDVTLVEFFDYNCGYCRSARPDVDRLLAEDPKLRVVYRELPILGPQSELASRASLAVAKLGNYGAFHRALFAAGRPTESTINAVLASANIDQVAFKNALSSPEIDQEIKNNLALQQSLGLTGTPSWVIGDQLIGGAVGYDELKAAIAEERAAARKSKT